MLPHGQNGHSPLSLPRTPGGELNSLQHACQLFPATFCCLSFSGVLLSPSSEPCATRTADLTDKLAMALPKARDSQSDSGSRPSWLLWAVAVSVAPAEAILAVALLSKGHDSTNGSLLGARGELPNSRVLPSTQEGASSQGPVPYATAV